MTKSADAGDTGKCVCPFCAEIIPEDSLLCRACSVKMVVCASCKKPVSKSVSKCPECGTSVP